MTRHCRQYRGRVSMRSRHPQDTVLDPDDGVKSSLSVLLPTSTDQPDASHASRPRKVSSCTTTSSTCTDSGIVRNKDYVNQMSGKGDGGGGGLWSTYSAKYCPPSLASYLLCSVQQGVEWPKNFAAQSMRLPGTILGTTFSLWWHHLLYILP